MKHILIVEDDLVLLKTMEALLSVRGYLISLARNGKEAIEKIASNHYDLVLTDLMLPYSNGLEVVSLLKQNEKNTPVIIISSSHSEDSVSDGFVIGADDYIKKPFAPSELLLRISRLLS